jgi:hypothetical protein
VVDAVARLLAPVNCAVVLLQPVRITAEASRKKMAGRDTALGMTKLQSGLFGYLGAQRSIFD